MLERHPIRKLTAIFVGGAIGALIRVGLSEVFPHSVDAWPWPTFLVNIAGTFLIGYLFAAFRDPSPGQIHHPFLAIGICGTLTTFSTMQIELFNMLDMGKATLAGFYLGASLGVGYLTLRLGIALEAFRPEKTR